MSVRVEVTVGARRFTNRELKRLEVRQELGQHSTCLLQLGRDSEQDLSLADLIGEQVEVSLQDEAGARALIFTGELREGSQSFFPSASGARGAAGSASSLTVEAISYSAWLEQAQWAYFRKATLGAIARKFGARLEGVTDAKRELDLLQVGETEFEFLCRLADESGCFVRTDERQPVIQRGFSEPAINLVWSDDLHGLSAVCRPQNHGFEGNLYEERLKTETTLRGVRKDPVWLTGADALTRRVTSLAARLEGGGDPNIEPTPFRAPDIKALRDQLLQESERQLGASVAVSGTSSNVRLAAGRKVRIEHGAEFRAPLTGEFGLVRVVHQFDADVYSNAFLASPWQDYTGVARPPRRLVPGALTAEVVDNVDPERRGRVKVRYRWQDAEVQSRWLRVATLYAGRDRGVLFVPEINDEVLVIFEHGDPERGVIIGSLWNGKDLAPFDGRNDAKRLVTRAGSTLQILDADGEERIEIFTPEAKCWLQLSNAGGKPCITLHSEGDLVLEAKGELRLTSGSFVQEVEGKSERAIGGNESSDVKGEYLLKAGVRLGAEAKNVTIKAGAVLESVAGGNQMIAGALVHIQPPGHQARPVKVKPPKARPSPWKAARIPSPTEAAKKVDLKPTPRRKP